VLKKLIEYLLLIIFMRSATGMPPEVPTMITLSFVGDCCLASNFGAVSGGSFSQYAIDNDPMYFFENVRSIFEHDDFTMVNLENVLSDKRLSPLSKPGDQSSNFWFIAPTSNAKILSFSGVDGVSVSNNHSGDYGETGLSDTIDAVTAEGLEYGSDTKTLYFEKKGFKIAVICQWVYTAQSPSLNKVYDRLDAEKTRSDFQIIFLHSGTEGTEEVDKWRINAFRKMVDRGADLVINSGPHAIQPMEVYKDVPIVYSLGNFCFGGNRSPRRWTMIYQAKLLVVNNKVTALESEIIPCYVYTGASNNFQPTPIEDEADKAKVFEIVRRKL
jgi:poly-gamma-glutamate synthesis protein (capsule biosynthesis protein)